MKYNQETYDAAVAYVAEHNPRFRGSRRAAKVLLDSILNDAAQRQEIDWTASSGFLVQVQDEQLSIWVSPLPEQEQAGEDVIISDRKSARNWCRRCGLENGGGRGPLKVWGSSFALCEVCIKELAAETR